MQLEGCGRVTQARTDPGRRGPVQEGDEPLQLHAVKRHVVDTHLVDPVEAHAWLLGKPLQPRQGPRDRHAFAVHARVEVGMDADRALRRFRDPRQPLPGVVEPARERDVFPNQFDRFLDAELRHREKRLPHTPRPHRERLRGAHTGHADDLRAAVNNGADHLVAEAIRVVLDHGENRTAPGQAAHLGGVVAERRRDDLHPRVEAIVAAAGTQPQRRLRQGRCRLCRGERRDRRQRGQFQEIASIHVSLHRLSTPVTASGMPRSGLLRGRGPEIGYQRGEGEGGALREVHARETNTTRPVHFGPG